MRFTPVILTFSLMLVAHGDDRETRANPSASTTGNCVTVPAGSSSTLSLDLEGSCSLRDRFSSFVQVSGANAPGFACSPYTLS